MSFSFTVSMKVRMMIKPSWTLFNDCEVDFLITQQKSAPRLLSCNQSSFLVLSYTPSDDVQLAFAMCFLFQETIFNIVVYMIQLFTQPFGGHWLEFALLVNFHL